MVGERGFEPPTPWSRKRDSGVVLNVFNLLQWCFNRVILAQSPHSGVNVSPRMAVPDQGFRTVLICHDCRPIGSSGRMRRYDLSMHDGLGRSYRLFLIQLAGVFNFVGGEKAKERHQLPRSFLFNRFNPETERKVLPVGI